MKNSFTVARVLTWFNLIFWIGFLGLGLLGVLIRQQFPELVGIFLFGAIPLHSYAALQLHKTIRYKNFSMSHHTPVGIRFVGIVAMFLGIVLLCNAFVVLSDPRSVLELMKERMPDLKQVSDARMLAWMRPLGVILLVVGLAIVLNVRLNSRLLRGYILLMKKKDNP